jgi:serine/threonine protein kinase/Tfp pilus assembly protein PilF
LKFLTSKALGSDEEEKRFLHEAQAAAALNHPNIATIHEIDEFEGDTFIAMEYCEGETLKEKVRSGPLKIEKAVNIAVQVAEGLQHAHNKGIIHRDIKSDNVMVTEEGQVKIMDFGLAKMSGASMVTKEGTTLGTIAYMSPEQARGETVDFRTDIWSLGVVLYEMLTGQMPFKGEYEQAVIYSILNVDPEPLTGIRTGISIDLEQIIKKALSKSADERYQKTETILDDFKKVKKALELQTSKLKDAEEELKPSIAVLPFANMSADPEQEYFCDGMSEEIINALTQLENLKVIARTSAFVFKGKHEDIREIGRKLDVETILEGSVRKAGNRLRITAQLIKTSDGSHIWSERYDREMEDVFDIQDEISLAIVENLKVKLLGKEEAAIVKRYTENVEAYMLYLKGRHFWQMLSLEGFEQAIEFYENALKKDPEYALAYAGIADVYNFHTYWGNFPPKEAFTKALEYVEKALSIDSTIAEAHASLGDIRMFYDWDWENAEKEYKLAVQLNPHSPDIHLHYYFYLIITGQPDKAVKEMRLAQELDPLSSYMNTMVGHALLYSGQFDKAYKELQKAIALNPAYFFPYYLLALTCRSKTMIDEVISSLKKAVEFSGRTPWILMGLARTYCRIGEKDKTESILSELKSRAKSEYVPALCFFYIYRDLGDKDLAYKWIEKACEERDSFLLWCMAYPEKNVRIPYDERSRDILKQIGLY